MKIIIILLAFITGLGIFSSGAQNLKKIVADAETQTTLMFDQIKQAKTVWMNDLQNKNKPEVVSPRSLTPEGTLDLVPSRDWTSGFFPGILWFLYELNGKQKWETQTRIFTSKIEQEKLNGKTHDMGFKIYCSFGNGFRLTKDPAFKEIIIQSANTLSTRFNPIVGCIRSWDHSRDK